MAAALRLVVLDDDPFQVELVVRALARDGFEVRGATTLDELAAAIAALAPDIVLVDVNMPDAPSDRAVAAVRVGAPAARLVLYSAWEASKLRALVRTLGADGYASKSDSVFELGARLRSLMA